MFTILILACSIVNPGPYGCGPRSNIKDQMVTIGKADTEAECFMKGNKELLNHPDTITVFHKVICIKGE